MLSCWPWGPLRPAGRDGGEAKAVILRQLAAAQDVKVAVHFDVDTIDSNELVLGLGAEPDGLTSAQARRIVAGIDSGCRCRRFTIAEFFPRQVMHLQQILDGFPLISGSATTR